MTQLQTVKIGGEEYLAAAGPLPGNLTQVEVGLRGVGVADGGARGLSPAYEFLVSCSGWWHARRRRRGGADGDALPEAARSHRDRRGRGHQRQPRLLVRFAVEGLRGAGQRAQRHAGAPAWRPDPSDDDCGERDGNGGGRWGGELSVDGSVDDGAAGVARGPQLADEAEDAYLKRTSNEYVAARKRPARASRG